MIFLVRHAHAGDKHQWDGPDDLRPLSTSGRHQAAGLLLRLGGFTIDAIVSSPAVRCRQTVDGLAGERGLPVHLDRRLARDTRVQDALDLITVVGDTDAVLCTHGELIGPLLSRLRDRGAPVPADAEWAKGSTWLLDVAGGAVVGAEYLPPLRLDRSAAR
jgi:phosphohistidine phosphatase SixA